MKAIVKSNDGVTLSLFLAPEGANDRTLIDMLVRQYPALRYADPATANDRDHVLVPIFQGHMNGRPVSRDMIVRSGKIAVWNNGKVMEDMLIRETHAIDAVTIRDAIIVPEDGSLDWEIIGAAVNGTNRVFHDGRLRLGDVVAGAIVSIWVRHVSSISESPSLSESPPSHVEFNARVVSLDALDPVQ